MKNEEELIEKILKGDLSSFEPLVRPYRQGVLNMAVYMTGDIEEAKEVCQESFIKIFRYLKSFKKGKSFKNWLYKTVINCSYDHVNKKRQYGRMVAGQIDAFGPKAIDPEETFIQDELRFKLNKCLQVLSPKERAIFILRDKQGLSIEETASILKSSSISIRANLSRARKKLRTQIEKLYPEEIRR
ncbi:MAG: RNA polymerase sigma factor [Candidatus Aminicenantes bacterium]|nr:RNA polymerase sigma factor [Candidatus Aminicenantes bacterium]